MGTRKQVYLFELDSVRDTDAEILHGQNALYEEIVRNGNTVVMTFNQVVDSRWFFSLISSPYSDALLSLFRRGFLRVSQFGSFRTLAQYVLRSIEKNLEDSSSSYIFSSIPVKGTQKYLLDLLRRSLIHADLSEIDEYLPQENSGSGSIPPEREISTLFSEFDRSGALLSAPDPSDEKVKKENTQKLRMLRQFIRMILALSLDPDIYTRPRRQEEYRGMNFHFLLTRIVMQMAPPAAADAEFAALWNSSTGVLSELAAHGADDPAINSRSWWHKALLAASRESPETRRACQMAEEIVDLCYNYAVELSICGVSRHYSIHELEVCAAKENFDPRTAALTFSADFTRRLCLRWKNCPDPEARYLHPETDEFRPFFSRKLPKWDLGNEVLEIMHDEPYRQEKQTLYEDGLQQQKRERKRNFAVHALATVGMCLVYTLIGVGLNYALNWVQELLEGLDRFGTGSLLLGFVKSFFWVWIFVILGSKLSTVMQKLFGLRSARFYEVDEVFDKILVLFRLLFGSLRPEETAAYVNTNLPLTENQMDHLTEAADSPQAVSLPLPRSITAYRDLCRKTAQSTDPAEKELFTGSDLLPVTDSAGAEALYSYFIRTGKNVGIPYRSRFHTLLVDLVREKPGDAYHPYERIINTVPAGAVVIIPKAAGRVLLLRQFRHALRREQLAFPRGFGEKNISPEDNAEKELYEELHAKAKKPPQYLGRVYADSGLSGSPADVFLIETEAYNFEENYEGIRGVLSFTESDLARMIASGEIDDGYTLAAWAFYKTLL